MGEEKDEAIDGKEGTPNNDLSNPADFMAWEESMVTLPWHKRPPPQKKAIWGDEPIFSLRSFSPVSLLIFVYKRMGRYGNELI